jgi:hypothetical protein
MNIQKQAAGWKRSLRRIDYNTFHNSVRERKRAMSIKSDYSAEEWDLLRTTILEAGGVMVALKPGGMIRESLAIFKTLDDLEKNYEGDPLIWDLLQAEPESPAEEQVIEEDVSPADELLESPDQSENFDENKAKMLVMCHEAVQLIESRGTELQAEEYRRLVMKVAEEAAAATKTGGFLGFGGKRIDEDEAALLGEIQNALYSSK